MVLLLAGADTFHTSYALDPLATVIPLPLIVLLVLVDPIASELSAIPSHLVSFALARAVIVLPEKVSADAFE